MDSLPPQPPTNTTPTTSVVAAATATQPSYPDSNDSSPRSRQTDAWDESLPQVPSTKLRIMCSYGGHIIPRPHDKSLCYVGGETRMVIIDRHSTLSSLSAHLSQSLLSGRHFTLKYLLPNEELDSLISVTTNEDFENMVEEYDRLVSTLPVKPSRLRLFLFLAKPKTAASMGSLLNDAKSETWFVDALNGTGLLRGALSDSAVGDCLLELDDGASHMDLEARTDLQENSNKHVKRLQKLQTTVPLVETGSSLESSSSSPSMSNLPLNEVQVDNTGAKFQNQMAGSDEQFSHMGISANGQKQDDGSAPPVQPLAPVTAVYTDDERLDRGVPTGFRKPPLPQQPVQRKHIGGYNLLSPDSKNVGGFNLHSPDSVASDSSVGSTNSLSSHSGHQEPSHISTGEHRATQVITPAANAQVHQHTYVPPPQQIRQQQKFLHPGVQYMHHHPTNGQAPISSYYPVYAPPPQQQLHHQIDQHNYPMYALPMSQTQVPQPYNCPIQANIADSTVVASSRPEPGPPQNNTIAPQPIYTNANHLRQQYASIQGNNPVPGVNYGYEYSHPCNEQVYYTQHPVVQLPPQHQTMTAATEVMLAQASAQLPTENSV